MAELASADWTRRVSNVTEPGVRPVGQLDGPALILRLAPVVFVCLWATGFVGARLGMPYAEPATFLALRFAIAFVLLGAIGFAFKAQWPKGRDVFHVMLVGAFVHGIYLGGVFWAVRNGMPAGISAVIVGLQPVLTAFLAFGLLGEAITKWHWVALPIGLIGVALVLLPGTDISSTGITVATVTASGLSVVAMAIGTIYQKRFATQTDLRTGTALQYVGALVPTLTFALLFESFSIQWNAQSIFAMAWLVLVLSLAAVFLLMWLIREGSVARVSSLFYLVPAVAALMTWFLFDETLLPIQIIGMTLCATAVALAAFRSGKERHEKV